METISLISLLEKTGAEYEYKGPDREIRDVTDNTNEVVPKSIFVCVRGNKFDGHTAARNMLQKGAAALVTDHDLGLWEHQIIVPDTREFYGRLCAVMTGEPQKKLCLIGITGTNGKTTTATLVHHILHENGIKAGFIGTTQVLIDMFPVEHDENTPTTPRVKELYSLFGRMAAEGCTHCVMEVSSFALAQNRIGPAVFDVSVFTNLTQDHLDYHGTMEEYFAAKARLFTREHSKTAFVNADDEYGRRLAAMAGCTICEYGRTAEGDGVRYIPYGFENGFARFDYIHGGTFPFELPMIGEYNVSNCTAAIAVCEHLGLPMEKIQAAVRCFGGVRGRCEIIPTGREFTLLCDYAHSPDALENMLGNVKANTKGRLICLFGCGGDRDRTKRPLMAAAAAKYADILIITSDNPRTENAETIIDEIIPGVPEGVGYIRITDRRKAIEQAIVTARRDDVVVLAGKGHEDYQIIGTEHTHFDEREVAADALKATITASEAAAFCGEQVRGDGSAAVRAADISSDTRSIKPGDAFIGLKGASFDGNLFTEKAAKAGAVFAVTERAVDDIPCVVVSDSNKALKDIAHGYRMRFDIPLIGITGSVGKTTTKEMTACVMGAKYNTLYTQGNHNNEVGMPFTLLGLNASHEAAVIEMGMSHFGEISRLSRCSVPNICVITNIGWSHAENLGDRDGIMKAKLEILEGAAPDAPLIVCGDDDKLCTLKDTLDRKVIFCGIGDGNDVTARDIEDTADGVTFTAVYGDRTARVCLGCKGEHHIKDALIAIAAGAEAGVPIENGANALEGYAPGGLRQHIEEIGGRKCLIDCYNAAPDSVKAALGVLAGIDAPKRTAVLADMLELGSQTDALHRQVGEYAVKLGIRVVCYGDISRNTAEGAKAAGGEGLHFEDKQSMVSWLKENLSHGEALLFKASRGMKMEEVIEALRNE
ncbi:MAG: UDP-N-acetylmuramoyl-L-alanyl-D-glutamate--2,6-diaminopimelate ligase [Oscillospiraceae bacterium]|nr:UDP-N-acetylmuramoyl-L-alanyl-D-glutamate--2,6-diaminopimelate ligase [Oscillospiraceae bacterium]